MKTLYIVRGPSGSGKSTIARHLGGVAKQNWFEADMWFMDQNDQYQFNPLSLGRAHEWCQAHVENTMRNKLDSVIVSNTLMTLNEIKPYLAMAEEFDYKVVIYKTRGSWSPENLATLNNHGVTQDVIERQIKKYQPHADEMKWNEK